MTRTEIKKKMKECLQKFDKIDSPDDMVSETMFNIYRQEMNELCRMFEKEFLKQRAEYFNMKKPTYHQKNKLPESVRYAFNEGVELYQCIRDYEIGVLDESQFITDMKKIKAKYFLNP